MTDFKSAIEAARDNDACNGALDELETMESWEEFFAHESAPEWSRWYAENVIKGRWLEAEDVIQQDAGEACRYAGNVIKGRWPDAEDIIRQDAYEARWYAQNVIKGRWPEAEDVIRQNPCEARWYAENVIKGRWQNG